MKYLITGGSGFIGSHLAEKLLIEGHQVSIIDNLSTGLLKNLSNIKDKVSFIHGNILDRHLTDQMVAECDFVVHLAASLGVFNIVNHPLASLITNLKGTEIVLEASDKYSKPILIASTSEIYGKNNKSQLREEDDRVIGHPLKSRWSYSEAKAIDESLGYFYYLEKNLPVRIVRFFNTVGPRQVGKFGMVVPRFVSSAINNESLQVYGSGEQVRCFCHVQDAVRAIVLIMESEKAVGQVFNVGNDQPISIIDLAKKVIEITNSSSKIIKVPYTDAYPMGFEDMYRRVPDISKINRVLGWSPKFGLDKIVNDIVKFHTSEIRNIS